MYPSQRSAFDRLNQCIRIDTLTPEQARIEVAKDVLALLKIAKIRAGYGSDYVALILKVPGSPDSQVDLRDLMRGMSEAATVCGIGAIFIAHVARFDNFKAHNTHHTSWDGNTHLDIARDDIVKHLRGVFSAPMLKVIEEVYEGWTHSGLRVGIRLNKIISVKFRTKEARLVAIMHNIVENYGDFVPGQLIE